MCVHCQHIHISDTGAWNLYAVSILKIIQWAIIKYILFLHFTRCVCETQMPPIKANFKDGQGHKDKYFDVQYESSNIS